MRLNDQEFHSIMRQFERDMPGEDFRKAEKDLWPRPLQIYYYNVRVNALFRAYLLGYANAKGLEITELFD